MGGAEIWAATSIAAQLYGGWQQAEGAKAAGDAQKSYYDELATNTELQIGSTANAALRQVAYNKAFADYGITTAAEAGARDASTVVRNSRAKAGTQRVAIAASGIDLGSATAEDLARSSFNAAEMDKLAIRYNTDSKIRVLGLQTNISNWEALMQVESQAEALRYQAGNYRAAGRYGVQAANVQATNSIIATAGNVGNSMYNYMKG